MFRASPGTIERLENRLFFSAVNPNHVLILSVDGLHQADVADPALAADLPNTLALQGQGVTYANAQTTFPSDSFPGTLSYLTGAGPGTTGVFYDVSYDRKIFAPGANAGNSKPGSVVTYDESIDKNTALLSGGGNFDASSIDPTMLPVDKRGHVLYPHGFLKVNTIFNIAHNAGLRTAFTDKHPVYEIANGPSGNGVDDLYTPELNSNVALLNLTTGLTVNADTLLATAPFTDLSNFKLVDASTDPAGANDPNLELTTNNTLLTEKYDDLHVKAILNEINGLDSKGLAAAAVPALFAGNFQAVSVAEKFTGGGITLDANGNEVVSQPLQSALLHTDASIGQIEAALKAKSLWSNTLFVLTAKHGQDPRVGSAQLIKDDVFTNVLTAAGIATGGASQDDGSLLWLSNQKQTAAAVAALTAFQNTGAITVFNKGVSSTLPANQVIDKILSGKALVAAGLGNPKANTRTPDIAFELKPGFILVGNPAHFTFKNAEHGGFATDDKHVALIVAGGKVSGANDGSVVADTVHTQQIAISALNALGLSANKLQGAKIERTKALPGLTATPVKPATPSHVVIVIEENHDANSIVGSANAPYINKTLIKNGLYYSNAHGTDHDSQPNYLELFSGANPGVPGINSPLQPVWPNGVDPNNPTVSTRENNSDNFNTTQPFSVPNLGAELLAKGLSFTGYSETLPSAGFTGVQYPLAPARRNYVEKHNAWAQFQGTGANQIPASTNQPLTAFPTDFSKLPSVSFVVPNETNDMHDTVSVAGLIAASGSTVDASGNPVSDATTIQHGDAWLKTNIEAYRKWATAHNSLLITLWDENDFNFARDNNIPIIVDGAPALVKKGVNTAYVNHFNTLRTVEDEFGLPHAGLSAVVAPYATNAKGTLIPSSNA